MTLDAWQLRNLPRKRATGIRLKFRSMLRVCINVD